ITDPTESRSAGQPHHVPAAEPVRCTECGQLWTSDQLSKTPPLANWQWWVVLAWSCIPMQAAGVLALVLQMLHTRSGPLAVNWGVVFGLTIFTAFACVQAAWWAEAQRAKRAEDRAVSVRRFVGLSVLLLPVAFTSHVLLTGLALAIRSMLL
ncbi:MAG: hypothetical protein ACOC0P_06265, partial [Planctomycetota bacterium]